jgi:hypothetical protein
MEFDVARLFEIYQKLEKHLEGTIPQPIALFSLRPTQPNLEMRINETERYNSQMFRGDGELFEVMREVAVY